MGCVCLGAPHCTAVFIDLGPFHVIVERCSAAVFESRLLELVVQSKWERNVWPRLKWIIAGYAAALGLSSVAMVASAGFGRPDSSLGLESVAWVDVAQVAVVVVETAALGNEVHQQVRRRRNTNCSFGEGAPRSAALRALE